MADKLDLPPLSRPPSYSTIDPSSQAASTATTAGPSTTTQIPPTLTPGTPRTYELHHISPKSVGLQIHLLSPNQSSTVLYTSIPYLLKDTPDIILYAGYDSHGPRLACTTFIPYQKDFKFYIGSLKSPSGDDWDICRAAGGGGLFSDPQFRFESTSNTPPPADMKLPPGTRLKTRMHWTKTSDSKLGASRLSPRDMKLIEESSDQVLAVYLEHNAGASAHKGTLTFRSATLDERAEMAALLVLSGILEKSRRMTRQVQRQNTNTWNVR